MTQSLEPNRIHTLPVQVSYHLPSSSQIFSTLLPTPQQVYVYPAAPGPGPSTSSTSSNASESWGSIYLKTVVQGVIMSSPEYMPGPSGSDLSLYIFDPRETFLRTSRSRVTTHPPHLRPSPLLASSPDLGNGQANGQGQEVWTGKGLVSKALEEPGVGKNLITGRLVRRREFTWISATEAVDPLQALMQLGQGHEHEDDEGSWGIEVSLGLKNGAGGQMGFGPQPIHAAQTAFVQQTPIPVVGSSSTSSVPPPPMPARHSYPAVPTARRPTMAPSARAATSYLPPSSDAGRQPSSTPARPPPSSTRKVGMTTNKKRPTPPPRHLASVDTNSRRISTSTSKPSAPSSTRGLPFEIPRHVYDNPDLLTKEQAERLIASPFFLDKLSEMTGHPLVPKVKRERDDDGLQAGSAKKSRHGKNDAEGEQTKCYNCGRTKSYVWRQMTLDDSSTVTICNACGIYRNRHGHMRPPSMWEGVDDEVKTLRLGNKLAPMPSSEIDLPAQRLDSGFKRTMSAVVEKDAKRIAGMRQPSAGPSTVARRPLPTRTMPMTSPPRGSRSAVKNARHSQSRIMDQQPAASSPGQFTGTNSRTPAPSHSRPQQGHTHGLQQAFVFNPDDSPNTALNKIIGASMPMQSLDLPLSDDGRGEGQERQMMPWQNSNSNVTANDMSAFFNLNTETRPTERFEMSAGPHGATSLKSPSPPPTFHRTSSAASKRRFYNTNSNSGGTDEDDVLSQLFNRTSSIGPLGSSPAPFDFSQLPPSSPPASNGPSSDIELELGHSALLLSSPDIASPPTPGAGAGAGAGAGGHKKFSPEKKVGCQKASSLNQSFTSNDLPIAKQEVEQEEGQVEGQGPPGYDYNIEELWAKLQSQYQDQQHYGVGVAGMASSGDIAEGLLGPNHGQGGDQHDDFLALFNSLTNA